MVEERRDRKTTRETHGLTRKSNTFIFHLGFPVPNRGCARTLDVKARANKEKLQSRSRQTEGAYGIIPEVKIC